MRYPRRCPRPDADGQQCAYVAWSDLSFRRHIIVRYAERWSVQRRGPHPYEHFIPMAPREAYERRLALANRQGGRGAIRRRVVGEARQLRQVVMPPPPPLPASRGRGRQRCPPPPPLPSSLSCNISCGRNCALVDHSGDRDDDINEYDSRSEFVYDDLHVPDTVNIRRIRGYATDDSDLEAAPPNDVMPMPSRRPTDVAVESHRRDDAAIEAVMSDDQHRSCAVTSSSTTLNSGTSDDQRRSAAAMASSATGDADSPDVSSSGRPLFVCRRDEEVQATTMSVDAATTPLPPPVFYHNAAQTVAVPTTDAVVEVAPQVIVTTADNSTWTGPVPRPWLATPGTDVSDLARLGVRLGYENPLLPVDALVDRITRAIDSTEPNERRTVQLMAQYGAEVLRMEADQLLSNISARFGDRADATLQTVMTYATDHLHVWRRRPRLPPPQVNLVDDDVDELHWLRD